MHAEDVARVFLLVLEHPGAPGQVFASLPRSARAGYREDRPCSFVSLHDCSKSAADPYMLDHDRGFGVPACVLRIGCIYGRRKLGTEDQGWLALSVGIPLISALWPDEEGLFRPRRPAGGRRR